MAIWETGLDYYWIEKDSQKLLKNISDEKQAQEMKQTYISRAKACQKLFFKAQIELAQTYKLPLIIHNRDAKDDVLEILLEADFKNFIFHCYSEDLEYANKLIAFAPGL